jgi:hypothetical protein
VIDEEAEVALALVLAENGEADSEAFHRPSRWESH